MSVSFSLVVTCWERADLLTFLYVMFSCVFVTFPFGVLGQVEYLSVLIPVLCHLPDFTTFLFWILINTYFVSSNNSDEMLDKTAIYQGMHFLYR